MKKYYALVRPRGFAGEFQAFAFESKKARDLWVEKDSKREQISRKNLIQETRDYGGSWVNFATSLEDSNECSYWMDLWVEFEKEWPEGAFKTPVLL